MHIVTLLPLTKKGKQIVKQHGDRWEVLRSLDKVMFSNDKGPWMLVVPLGEKRVDETVRDTRQDSASRWVHAFFDKNFKVAP